MDRATFEKQKAFAGEKKPSMQRRCVDNDYMARRMYMITMVTEGRKMTIRRGQCMELNEMARRICEGK
jgi:hypothetical protein